MVSAKPNTPQTLKNHQHHTNHSMPQNAPNRTLATVEASDKTLARIPLIIKGLIQGYTLEAIAENLGIDRKTLYRDRQTIQYTQFLNDLLDVHLEDIKQLSNDPRLRHEATKERGRMLRSMIPKTVYQRTETQQKLDIHLYTHKTESES